MNPDAPTGPAAASAHASSDIAGWFRDEKELLARVQRVVLAPVPSVVGCDHLREISRGGQGIVYEGVQVGTRRKVAVKVLSDASVTSRRGLLRFQREADLAAGLSHPGIVRIYDSGVTPAGQAYIVMEFVEGIPLDAWTQQRHDDVPALLQCFARICDAVQHAHTRGVIHRDLKPSNILVDSDNQPRVLDFGLAKALRDHTTGAEPRPHPQNATVTAQGQFVGSLPFASPEQVRGEALDIRSDVYSLGVILHHALTGNLPIDVRRSLDQALRAIVEEAPTPLRRQRSTLHEELEVIALTALAKDPAHRYQSALALASDVRAHLAGEPIAARRESAWRALRRRAARQRVLAWAGLAVLSITVGATLVSTSALRAAQRDRDAATQARARSDAASQFLTDILGAANPMRDGGGRDAKVADQLALASAQIDARFPDDPLTRAALRDVLGQAYAQLSLLPEARAEFAAALAALDALADAPPALAPDADDAHLDLRIRGNVAGLRAMEEGWPAALSEFESVVAAYESRGVIRSESFASTLSDLGVCLRNLSRYDAAAAAYDRALAALPSEALEGKTHSTILLNQATLVEAMRTAQEALPLMERALAMQERAFGPESMQTLTAQSNLGFLLIEVGRPADGVAMLRKAMETCERIAGESAPTTLILMNNLAKALLDMGELDEAQRVFERCIAIYDRDRPTDARITAPLGSLGFLFAQRRDHEAALRISERALDVEVRLRGENTPDWITALNNMGVSLDRVGRLAESEEYLRKAVRFSAPEAGILPAGNFRHHVYRITLANNLTAQGKLDEAIALIRDAQQKLRESVGESHWAYDAAVRSLAKWEAKKAAQP